MQRTISYPSGLERSGLDPAEEASLAFFDSALPPDWEIYVRPHLNGLAPGFVLLSPAGGIAVVEVRGWTDAFLAQCRDDALLREPFARLRLAKEEIFEIYCPRPGLAAGRAHRKIASAYSAMRCGLICPQAELGALCARFAPGPAGSQFISPREWNAGWLALAGRGELAAGQTGWLLPNRGRHSPFMRPEYAQDVRRWLVAEARPRRPEGAPVLDARQKAIAASRTQTGYRRIRGPAGSGKTLVLCRRAALLAGQGLDVLFLTYNVTLVNYIRHLVQLSLQDPAAMDRVVVLSFHALCKRLCLQAGLDAEYQALWPRLGARRVLEEGLPRLAMEAARLPSAPRFDAVVVDEGQDFLLSWWNVARALAKPEGEKLLAADRAQDVYGKAGTWTEAAMADSGFSGPWAELASSHRLPAPVDRMARDYAARFLPKDMYQPPQRRELTLGDAACSLRWIQCRPDELADACCDALLELVYDPSLPREEPLVFLCQSTEAGQAVVQRLEAMHVACQHTFGADEAERRQQKMSFSASPGGPARVRATTVYSFKGWEASRLVLAVGRFGSARDRFAVYAGLTRVKDSPQGSTLSVVCAAPGLEDFGARHFALRRARSGIAGFAAAFLRRRLHAFAAQRRGIPDCALCGLAGFDFRNRTPDYRSPLHRSVYYLRYGAASLFEYYGIFRFLLQSGWLAGAGSLALLSCGCGAMLDAAALKFALDGLDPAPAVSYHGIDLVDWQCPETRLLADMRFTLDSIASFTPAGPYQCVVFPKSLPEMDKAALDGFLARLGPDSLAPRCAFVFSKRAGSRLDHEKAEYLCRRAALQFGFTERLHADSIFDAGSKTLFSAEACGREGDEVERLLDLADVELESLGARCLNCDCPRDRRACQAVIGRRAMRRIKGPAPDGGEELRAAPEIYFMGRQR